MSAYPRTRANLVALRDFQQAASGARLAKLTEGMPKSGITSDETKARMRELQARREHEQKTREVWE